MRILVYSPNFSPELIGIGKYVGEMSEWLSLNGHEVHVITTPPFYPKWKTHEQYNNYLWKREKWKGVNVWRCPVYVPKNQSGVNRILHLVSFALSSLPIMISQIFWRPKIILSIAPSLFLAPVSILTSKLSGAKSILHIQDLEVDAAFELGLLKGEKLREFAISIEKFLLGHFDLITTISNRMLRKISNKLNHTRRVILFPNWIKMSLWSDDREMLKINLESEQYRTRLKIPKEALTIVYSGNMGDKQGLEILSSSAKYFMSNPIPNIPLHFIFCGSGSGLKKLLNDSQGIANIHFLDLQPTEKLPAFLAVADIHVLPQRADAADLVMPSKLIGIFASGRPVIVCANQDTELSEIVRRRGLVVKPENTNDFCEAIKILANDKELRSKLGSAGKKYAEQEFDQDLVLAKFEFDMKQLVKI